MHVFPSLGCRLPVHHCRRTKARIFDSSTILSHKSLKLSVIFLFAQNNTNQLSGLQISSDQSRLHYVASCILIAMIDVVTPRKLTFIIATLIVLCTIVAIVEEWFLEDREFFQSLGLFGFFGGLSGLATKYKQYLANTRIQSRIRKPSTSPSISSSRDNLDDSSDQHALIDMNHYEN